MKTRPPKRFETAEEAKAAEIAKEAEMAEEAKLNADTIIGRLLKSPKQEVQQLGLKLEACLADDSFSCGSAACYVCRGQASQSFKRVRGQGFWERLQVRLSESLAHRLIDLKRLDCGIANAVV